MVRESNMITYPMRFVGSLVFLCYGRIRNLFAFIYEGDTIDGRHLDWFALLVTLTIMSTVFGQMFFGS